MTERERDGWCVVCEFVCVGGGEDEEEGRRRKAAKEIKRDYHRRRMKSK